MMPKIGDLLRTTKSVFIKGAWAETGECAVVLSIEKPTEQFPNVLNMTILFDSQRISILTPSNFWEVVNAEG
jgi:hypothetical protein